MFKSFFLDRNWWSWSVFGSIAIMLAIWYQVQISVMFNDWYGEFYNTIQQALSEPNSVTLDEYMANVLSFFELATIWIVVLVGTSFFTRHYVFRWRTAMNNYYIEHWTKLRHIEGAAQRVQEDTMRFASIVEGLGVAFLKSILSLIAFLPILWELSGHITELPWVGAIDHSLIYIAIMSAIFGTVFLAIVGIKLPGLEFNNQLVEAAYRKELVFGEDHEDRAAPPTVRELFANVRKNYFRLYLHYGYFDLARFSYIQYSVVLPMLALGPTIVVGAITFGLYRQILHVFGQVEDSFRYLATSWSTIVELISIYKRLNAFESNIDRSLVASSSA
ncbi:MAG: peptide antibiotic transporter SbmA [Aestuariibacter sp.]|nr:peptide antibiotic transporter SbmA [Aestuariibacter sp.]